MSKSTIIKIIIAIIILVILIVGALYIFQQKKEVVPAASLENKPVSVESQPSKTLKDYIDTAGFSFKYPEDLIVNKKDTSDPAVYASLEIVSGQAKGSISINVLDTKFKSADDWLSANKLVSAKEIKIGEMSGKEATLNNKVTAAALDQGILFQIEVDSQDQKYWADVYNTILSSFSFAPQQSSNQPSDNSSDVILDEETVE